MMIEPVTQKINCPDCRALVPDIEGAVHKYLGANAGCWKRFGELLAREYGDRQYWKVHRLTCDTYAVQHPGKDDQRARQSVNAHLVSLYLLFEKKWSFDMATKSIGELTKHKSVFEWLEPPSNPGEMTVVDVLKSTSAENHCKLVREWANCVWKAWKDHHPTIKSLAQTYLNM